MLGVAVDIDEGGANTVRIEGASCSYVLSVVARAGLEVSVYANSRADLSELKEALATALAQKRPIVLLRAEASTGGVNRWQALEPDVFVPRLPSG